LLANILAKGIVQGVGFRPFVYRLALENNLRGFVQNRGDAGVTIVVEGDGSDIDKFIKELQKRKPAMSQIHELAVSYRDEERSFLNFEIRESFRGGEEKGSTIPADISICNDCLKEMCNPDDNRYGYFFITCTNCGPRYTLITALPYDRINTSMNQFPMCSVCEREYRLPDDRRFHAQTSACPDCGPQLLVTDSEGKPIGDGDQTEVAGRLLDESCILAVKGNGGFHLVCSTLNSDPLRRLRKVKERRSKPFAIMARDLSAIASFAEINEFEAQLLESYAKPIVLLNKSGRYFLSDLISPGLHTVGVMLPYSGFHHLIFRSVRDPALVMTSANPPNEPIIIENDVAIKRLGNVADYFVFHNRSIEQRCDDSVLRAVGSTRVFIRRSRGFAPTPIILKAPVASDVLALGAELNATCCILVGHHAFLSQHIGDIETPETLSFLESTTKHLLGLTKAEPRVLACDLHPKFSTTVLAKRLGEQWDIPVVQVQHHHAHLSKLMSEHGVDEAVGIVCDGYGYGSNGEAWGGEILYSDIEEFKRIGHLQEQPMVGGDLATKYPLRMVAGILHNRIDVRDFLLRKVQHFPRGKEEIEVTLRQLETRRIPTTSSCGRVLDAVAAMLELCYERTYEGEPAMKLEAAAANGKDVLQLEAQIKGDVVNTEFLLEQIYDQLGKARVSDLASSTQSYLARSLSQLAVENALKMGVSAVGFTGGVACNEYLSITIKSIVEENNLTFLSHNEVPPGDGGLSFGQAVTAARQKENA